MQMALRLNDAATITEVFVSCTETAVRRQVAYMLARQQGEPRSLCLSVCLSVCLSIFFFLSIDQSINLSPSLSFLVLVFIFFFVFILHSVA